MTLPVRAKVLLHVWSYCFYDTITATSCLVSAFFSYNKIYSDLDIDSNTPDPVTSQQVML